MTISTKPIPPTRRNAAETYLRRYLNAVSDWNTYLTPNAGSLGEQAESVTGAFFGSKILQGAALLFGAHLSQQITASTASIVARGWLRGEELGAQGGITIRKLQPAKKRRSGKQPAPTDLIREFDLLLRFSGLADRLAEIRDHLRRRIIVQDGYYFTEAGRTWLCYTLCFPVKGSPDRLLTGLTMLSFPNRSYYFDRVLPFNLAVDLTRGRIEAESTAGFIGDTVELDLLLPLVRLFKLGLYGLNWYLIDPAERDNAPLPEVAGYNTLIPPAGPSAGTPGNPYTTKPKYGARRTGAYPSPYATPTPRDPYAYDWRGNVTSSPPPGPPVPPIPPDYFGAAATPVQTSFLSQENTAGTTISPAPVNIAIELGGESGNKEVVWVTIEEDAYRVVDRYGQPTGLAIAPAVTLDDAGNFITHPDRWGVIHTETGRVINPVPVRALHQARQLADQLASAVNWRRPFEQLTPAERARAQTIIHEFGRV